MEMTERASEREGEGRRRREGGREGDGCVWREKEVVSVCFGVDGLQ